MTNSTIANVLGAFVLGGLIVLGLASIFPVKGGAAETWEDVYHATVKLGIEGDGEICTAEFVDEDTLLTAGHCTELTPAQKDKLYILTWDGHKWPVTIDNISLEYDTATLELLDGYAWTDWVNVAPVGFDPAIGTPIVHAGFPDIRELGEFELFDGTLVLKAENAVYWASESYTVTVPVKGGASGGGLYIDTVNGPLLIGTTQGAYNWMDEISYFSTVEGVNAVLQ